MPIATHIQTALPERRRRLISRFVATFAKNLGLAWILYLRDLRVRYRQSFLGTVWHIFLPFVWVLLALFLSAEGFLSQTGPFGAGSASLMASLTLWQFFADCFHAPWKSVQHGKSFLNRTQLAEEAVLGAEVFAALVNLGVRLLCALTVGAVTHTLRPEALPLLVPAIPALLLLGLGVGLICAGPVLVVRDLQQGISKGIVALMLITPVVFPIPASGALRWVMLCNPLSSPILFGASGFTRGSPEVLMGLTIPTLLGVACVTVGIVLFKNTLRAALECLGDT